MFDYFFGVLTDTSADNNTITVDINGIGYLLYISTKDFYNLPEINSKIKVFSVLIHKEDSITLYGFLQKDSRNIFNILTSVSGVGPKMALQILNEFDPLELTSIVASENYKELTRSKGVGPKLAQKIIIEIKDKFKNTPVPADFSDKKVSSSAIDDTKAVLISFGYQNNEIEKAVNYAINAGVDYNDTESVLKTALQFLSQEM